MAFTDSFGALARGGDTAAHNTAIFLVNIGRLLAIGLVVFSLAAAGLVWATVTPEKREIFIKYQYGRLLTAVQMPGTTVNVRVGSREVPMRAELVEPALDKHYPAAARAVYNRLLIPALLGLAAAVMTGLTVYREGIRKTKDAFIRGQQMVGINELTKRVLTDNPSPVEFGLVPVPWRQVFRNFLTLGSMGTGKSQILIRTMQSLRNEGIKTIVYDPTGEFAAGFFRPDIDVILNPVDQRCAPWSVFDDIRDQTDPALIATAFVPDRPDAGANKFWSDAARTLLEDMLRIGKREGVTMAQLSYLLSGTTAEQLANILIEHRAKSVSLISGSDGSGSNNTTQGIRAELTSNSALRYLDLFEAPPEGEDPFSVREWVETEDDSWLFLTSKADLHDSIKPFIAVFLQLALAQAMDVPRQSLRVAFIIDELESAGKIEALNTALTQARKFGIFTMIGVQSYSQIVKVYGRETAQTFLGNLQNKLILRVEESESAKLLADLLGKEEIHEVNLGSQYGVNSESDSASISTQRKDRYVVHPSELTVLKDMTGYLKLAGQYPVAKVEYEYVKLEQKEPPLIKREIAFS